MINTNYAPQALKIQPISFQGKSRSIQRYSEDFFDVGVETIKKEVKAIHKGVYQAYAGISEKVRLQKTPFGYKHPENSIELQPYKEAVKNGFSTESGGYGGGWLKADINTPLSTKDIHTCAGLNLANDSEHFFFHVYHSTRACDIAKFIKEKFPDFHTVNIMPGDMLPTNTTVNSILEALKSVNKKTKPNFYHAPLFGPEVVACNGKLSYIKSLKSNPDKMSFKEITNQYFYGD